MRDQIRVTLQSLERRSAGRWLYSGLRHSRPASDHGKPNGQFVITPRVDEAFVQDLLVGKFHGIGPATSAKMNGLGIYTGMDMRNQTVEFMNANFGKAGSYYYWISLRIDERPVRARRRDNLLAGSDGLRRSVARTTAAGRQGVAPL
jgi:nucleotidyltransferase/DNA polymerase involved in DNA repair